MAFCQNPFSLPKRVVRNDHCNPTVLKVDDQVFCVTFERENPIATKAVAIGFLGFIC